MGDLTNKINKVTLRLWKPDLLCFAGKYGRQCCGAGTLLVGAGAGADVRCEGKNMFLLFFSLFFEKDPEPVKNRISGAATLIGGGGGCV